MIFNKKEKKDTRHLGYPTSSNGAPLEALRNSTAVSEPAFSVVTLSSPVLTTQRPNGRLGLPNVGKKFGKLRCNA